MVASVSGQPYDPARPSSARISNYWLGGTAHTAADRALAAEIARINPRSRDMALASRLFTARTVSWAVSGGLRDGRREPGVRQVIDLGAGMPPHEQVHQVARAVRPGTAVAYVDCDPEVGDFYDVMLSRDPAGGLGFALADFRDPDAVLADPGLAGVIDLARPVLLLFTLSLYGLPPRRAGDLVAAWAARVAAGSLVAVSAVRVDDPAMWVRLGAAWGAPGWNWSRAAFRQLFGGLELVPPGIAPAASYRPGWEEVPMLPAGPAYVLAGIGRKP